MPTHLLKNPDEYITRVGKFLRKTSLDELPPLPENDEDKESEENGEEQEKTENGNEQIDLFADQPVDRQ